MVYKANEEQLRIESQITHFMRIGRYEKIKPLAADLISRFPSFSYGYYSMSVYESRMGRTDNAIELCRKSIEYGMSRLAAGIMLMLYYDDKHDYSNVDAEFYSLKQQFPFNNEALAIYGYSLCHRGQKENGMSILEEAFSNDPSDPMVIKYLFTASKKSRSPESLDTLLKLYMNSGASDKQKLILAGLYEIRTNRWGEASECFGRVLGMDPTDAEALNYMKIIKIRKHIPVMFLEAVGYGVFVYFLKFEPQNPLTYVYFLPSLFFLAVIVISIIKMRSI